MATAGSGKARSRTSDTYARIRDDVILGHFAPGSKLKIEALRERYGLGATPIREALSMLTADGLVERVDQRGFRVAEVSSGEFEELLAIRCNIEERALRLAMERGSEEWEEAIVLARYRLARTPRLGPDGSTKDLEWENCHKGFHMALTSACGSPILLRLCNQLYDENNRYRCIARLNPSARPNIYDEHEEIAEAVLARDADLAVRLIVEHYTTTGRLLHAALCSREEAAALKDQSAAAKAGPGHRAATRNPERV
ncbi:GntR family transcriptional regulator [Afifella sp. IM 167]|uniref:GntR family transcriptional regulator n=1 Tax=Afifella sp. IM 167 TaxID=2033586 RepID=UPI001CCD8556|nr:FCD domain-containing protein [Afifella sp. IM 167]MBZ8133734.1 GntR family transcriptional regulator [Afifella sp. IM 167]